MIITLVGAGAATIQSVPAIFKGDPGDGGSGGTVTWNNVTGKPTSFTPSTHTHSIAQVTGLQTALDGKQPTTTFKTINNETITGTGNIVVEGGTGTDVGTHKLIGPSDTVPSGWSVISTFDAGGVTLRVITLGVESPSLSRLALHIDSDIDTVGERDDIAAMALWLADQENFNILGMTTSPPDSNSQEYLNCINAYEQDRPTIISKVSDPRLFKTAEELRSLVVTGTTTDAPSRGYRLPGESQYANAHAAAQLLIENARQHGDPTSNDPTRKLWVAVQGGYNTLAQALYEAVELQELPDICSRIRVVGQPNWNSSRAPNSWNYIFLNMDPGDLFEDLWMLSGYYQWHAFNRDNGTTDTTFWNQVTERSAFGQHLRNTLTRPGGTFLTPHFRAGDAGIWFWIKSAKVLNNFDPTNPENFCGVYRTYAGVTPWPSRTVGYGNLHQTSNPNPEGTTLSETHWAPLLTVSDYPQAQAAVNLTEWYSQVAALMDRYKAIVVPVAVNNITVGGTETARTLSWLAPNNGGSPITAYRIYVEGQSMVEVTGTSYNVPVLPDGLYTVTISAVNAIGEGPASQPVAFRYGNIPVGTAANEAFRLNEGTGSTITAQNGLVGTATSANWLSSPTLLRVTDTNNRLSVPIPNAVDNSDHIYAMLVRHESIDLDRVMISRTGTDNSQQRHSQFRISSTAGAGQLQYVLTPYFATGVTSSQTIASPNGVVVANQWAIYMAYVTAGFVRLYKNDQIVAQAGVTTPQNRNAAMLGVPHQIGARFNPANSTYVGNMVGNIGGFTIKYQAIEENVAQIRNELMELAVTKGITLP